MWCRPSPGRSAWPGRSARPRPSGRGRGASFSRRSSRLPARSAGGRQGARRSCGGGRSSLFRLLVRSQHEQQAAVVVCGKHVGFSARGHVAFARNLDRYLEFAHAPLEHRGDRIISVGEAQTEHLGDTLTDHVLLLQPGEGEGVLAAADHATLAVADEEGGVGRRVVVIEKFEQEREAALRAALALACEAEIAVELARAVAAVWADEGMGHDALNTDYASRALEGPVRAACRARPGRLKTATVRPARRAPARDARRPRGGARDRGGGAWSGPPRSEE